MNGKKKILIVQDDVEAAATFERQLLQAGYDVKSLGDGVTALDWLLAQTADLIVLDPRMHGLSGLEVCRQLRQRSTTRSTPIIFLSKANAVTDMAEGSRVGGDLYLTQPLSPSTLLAMVGMFVAESPLIRKSEPLPN